MTRSVLCAVDISIGDDDLKTIQTANRMAGLDNAQLGVIAVVPDFGISQVGNFFGSDYHDAMVAEAEEHLNALVIKTLGEGPNSKVRHVVATGRAYEEVLKLAQMTNPSLIVVGAHKTELADYLLGPNVVRHAKCFVYVVRS